MSVDRTKRSTLFPYTTLFRSARLCHRLGKVKYLLADHCSNNSGTENGAIAHLKKWFPNIKFAGCKDHLFNLLVKLFNEVGTRILAKHKKFTALNISNEKGHTIFDYLQQIMRFIQNPQNYADSKVSFNFVGIPNTNLNRYLNGTRWCDFLLMNLRVLIKFLKTHSFKKNDKTTKWIEFLNNPVVLSFVVFGSFLNKNFLCYLKRFHGTTSSLEYGKILTSLKLRFKNIHNNPNTILTRSIHIESDHSGETKRMIFSDVINNLDNDTEKMIFKTMSKSLDLIDKHEKLDNPDDNECRMITNTRTIERSFGTIAKMLDKNKRTSELILTSTQKVRLYTRKLRLEDLPIDKFTKIKREARSLLENKPTFKKSVSRVAKKRDYFTSRIRGVTSSFVGKRKRDYEKNEGPKRKRRKNRRQRNKSVHRK